VVILAATTGRTNTTHAVKETGFNKELGVHEYRSFCGRAVVPWGVQRDFEKMAAGYGSTRCVNCINAMSKYENGSR
jgi:hypothetical protein